jgi:hypothetical protein
MTLPRDSGNGIYKEVIAAQIDVEEESIPDRVESYARKTTFDYPSATPLTPT